jgi:uncharacterized membrane protein YfhO
MTDEEIRLREIKRQGILEFMAGMWLIGMIPLILLMLFFNLQGSALGVSIGLIYIIVLPVISFFLLSRN